MTWSDGHFTGDGAVDFGDLLALARNYGHSTVSATPAPATIAADWALAQSLVPAPASAAIAAMLLWIAGGRRGPRLKRRV